jgi:pimeloyl-ACP methyl ester carboxylesterase
VTKRSLRSATTERLKGYYAFSDAVVATIADFADTQAEYDSYQAFFSSVGVSTSTTLYVNEWGSAVPVIDLSPKGISKGTIVVHLPMANPLDPNQLYQIATIVGTNPDYRVIGFGNPSGKPYRFKEQNLTILNRLRIATRRTLRPLVDAELSYLESQRITDATHVGYSYGAAKALIESGLQAKDNVRGLVVIELVSHPRGLKQLASDFKSTLAPLGEYADRPGLETYLEARRNSIAGKEVQRGLVRPINLAIGFILARLDLLKLLKDFTVKNPAVPITIAWGSKSELVDDALMQTAVRELKETGAPVQAIRLPGLHHALANDIHLHAAIIRQALEEIEG